jgi:hypothetical protein
MHSPPVHRIKSTPALTGMLRLITLIITASSLCLANLSAADNRVTLWQEGRTQGALVLPTMDESASRLAHTTINRYLQEFYGIELPVARSVTSPGIFIVLGTPSNNPAMARLVRHGLKLGGADLGEEGFRLLTFDDKKAKCLVIYGMTPRALKFGCQELIFYHLAATRSGASIDWPVDVTMRPSVSYRGIYMLPCWAQHDSIDSWKRVLRFNSELTLNRVWFWLDGFPVAGHRAVSHIEGHVSDFDQTPLANEANVQSLIDLANAEDMKFYIGGGWMSWHHKQAVGDDRDKARDFYFAYLRTFKGVGGFYFEPTGEGSESHDWRPEVESLRDMIHDVTTQRPDFEVAVAVGRFNNHDYLKTLSTLDPKRVFWWWCWGDPLTDDPFAIYPTVLAWHTVVRMSDIHGSTTFPSPAETRLAGISTSYDPGMGFGNPWNGYSTLGGAPSPRNFDPYTMPYFSHEYRFRERCWNRSITDKEFARRLGRRLFDADMPAEAITHYLALADFCFNPAKADAKTIEALDHFVSTFRQSGTPRNQDTFARMDEAIKGLRQVNAKH